MSNDLGDIVLERHQTYNGNMNLKRAGAKVPLTEEQLIELARCKADPIYFARNYVKIVHVDRGFINMEPYDYQEEIMRKIHKNRRVICLTGRQMGKCFVSGTLITVRNKATGLVEQITVGELRDRLAKSRSKE